MPKQSEPVTTFTWAIVNLERDISDSVEEWLVR